MLAPLCLEREIARIARAKGVHVCGYACGYLLCVTYMCVYTYTHTRAHTCLVVLILMTCINSVAAGYKKRKYIIPLPARYLIFMKHTRPGGKAIVCELYVQSIS